MKPFDWRSPDWNRQSRLCLPILTFWLIVTSIGGLKLSERVGLFLDFSATALSD